MTFIEWIKNLYEQVHDCTNCYDLLGSNVRQPTDLLLEHIRNDESALSRRLTEPNNWGHPKLIDAIARKYSILDKNRILVTSGCSSAIYLIYRTLLAAGDHIIVESPYYDPYLTTAAALQVRTIPLQRPPNDFKVDLAELESLITPQTKLIVLTNLHNPGGTLLEMEEGLLIGNIPSEACFFFPQVVGVDDASAFAEKLAEQYQVFVSPGNFFGAPCHIRIGFGGPSEQLEKGLQRLVSAIRDHGCHDET